MRSIKSRSDVGTHPSLIYDARALCWAASRVWPCLALHALLLASTSNKRLKSSRRGLHKRNGMAARVKQRRPLLEGVSADRESKFARALGSSDYHTREAGLSALQTWLARKADIEAQDLLKLWKGIFYCFWHSDKAPVQVRRLSSAARSACT